MSPSNHHNRRNHRQPPPILARSSKYRTICDLPVELLCMIISHVKSDTWTIRTCTLVCHCLRAVSLEHHFRNALSVRDIDAFDHLFSFLRANPKICEKTGSIRLSGATRKVGKHGYAPLTSIDDNTVLELTQLLPNLTALRLGCFVYIPPQLSAPRRNPDAEQDPPAPFRLEQLSFGSTTTSSSKESSISGLFRILSMFDVDSLYGEPTGWDINAPIPSDISSLHRPLRTKKLRLWKSCLDDSKFIAMLLEAFTKSLEPGYLQDLEVECSTISEVSAIGQLLARVGQGLTSLQVSGKSPPSASMRDGWKDPMDSHWESLNLASCPRLESININIYFRASGDEKQPTDHPALSLAGAGMLSQASGTLRKIAIWLHDLPRITTLNNRRLLRLQAFDRMITQDRFPLLEEVKLRISVHYDLRRKPSYDWQKVVLGTQKALRGLHSRGLLEVTGW
ncbi:hypothetical protein BD311DRAFT_725041 [Dichomitus squalens]|uniref:F-box domain-containing protein n=1 Tax=Dichomitus squalens TaxID=114155 RepID=A0A4Q9MJR7_9APHY|nr:hypothetical protein BD311DRAFT_725041 [Dichomitus squalens]